MRGTRARRFCNGRSFPRCRVAKLFQRRAIKSQRWRRLRPRSYRMIHFSSLGEFMAHLRGRDFANKSTWLPGYLGKYVQAARNVADPRETVLSRRVNRNFAREIAASSKRQPRDFIFGEIRTLFLRPCERIWNNQLARQRTTHCMFKDESILV